MKRDLEQMAAQPFDVLIIGGGIAGATVAWDAALRGLRVGLVEKSDFGASASAGFPQYIPQGLHALMQGDVRHSRAQRREHRILARITPHLMATVPAVAPLRSRKEQLVGWGATHFYRRQATSRDVQGELPRLLDIEALQTHAPALSPHELIGGVAFPSGLLYHTSRHLLAFLHSAVQHGAQVANYTEALEFVVDDGRIRGAVVRDTLSDRTVTLRARCTVHATGAWTARLLNALAPSIELPLRLTKQVYLLTHPATPPDVALRLPAPASRSLWMLPWRQHAVIGPFEQTLDVSPEAPTVTQPELQEALAAANEALPSARLTRDDVTFFCAHLQAQHSPDAVPGNSAPPFIDHADDGFDGLYTLCGHSYAQARPMAAQLVDALLAALNRAPVPCTTDVVPTVGGATGPFSPFLQHVREQYGTLPHPTAYHLARCYGTQIAVLMDHARRGPVLLQRPNKQTPDIMAQVDYAVRHEMAHTLADVLLRRTGIGTLGAPSLDTLEAVAQRMASLLGWDSRRFDDEVETMRTRYRPDRPASASAS